MSDIFCFNYTRLFIESDTPTIISSNIFKEFKKGKVQNSISTYYTRWLY